MLTEEQQSDIDVLRHEKKLSLRDIAEIILGDRKKESVIRRYLKKEGNRNLDTNKTALLTQHDLDEILMFKEQDVPIRDIAEKYDVNLTLIRRIWEGEIEIGIAPKSLSELDRDSKVYYANLQKRNQRQRDLLRVERKHTRENSRVTTMLEELTSALIDTFQHHDLSPLTVKHDKSTGKNVGIIQISDVHFGEKIIEVYDNMYDLSVAAARLKKFVNKAKQYFDAVGVSSVLLALTGDLINSDRRLDEVTSNAANRADVVFCAVDILQQVILDLNQSYNVTVASICGNESRIGKDVGWVNFIASDSFDAIIHNVLSRLFKGSEGVHFVEMKDPLECIVEVNGSNVLMVHGHNGLANTARMEGEVAKMKAKYATRGTRIDYTIAGHIHSAYVSDMFARSSGLPGGNAYSDKALNLASRSSQNIYIVDSDGGIDGVKIDLQEYDKSISYAVTDAEAYKPAQKAADTYVIQSVVI